LDKQFFHLAGFFLPVGLFQGQKAIANEPAGRKSERKRYLGRSERPSRPIAKHLF
jgi:hypothetical protein